MLMPEKRFSGIFLQKELSAVMLLCSKSC